jgi:hypothetical protein
MIWRDRFENRGYVLSDVLGEECFVCDSVIWWTEMWDLASGWNANVRHYAGIEVECRRLRMWNSGG